MEHESWHGFDNLLAFACTTFAILRESRIPFLANTCGCAISKKVHNGLLLCCPTKGKLNMSLNLQIIKVELFDFCEVIILLEQMRIQVRSFWKEWFDKLSLNMGQQPPLDTQSDFPRFTNKSQDKQLMQCERQRF